MTTWRETAREQRKELILEAAARVFARNGFQRATMREIADEAGIATGTIYLYFDDKRDLLLSIAEQLVHLIPRELPSHATPDEERSFIRCVLDEQLRVVEEYRPFFRAVVGEMWTDDSLRTQYLNRVLAPLVNTIELFLKIGIETGKARPHDPQIVARAMLGTVFLFAITSEMETGDYLSSARRDALAHELTDFFLYGVRQQPEEVP